MDRNIQRQERVRSNKDIQENRIKNKYFGVVKKSERERERIENEQKHIKNSRSRRFQR